MRPAWGLCLGATLRLTVTATRADIQIERKYSIALFLLCSGVKLMRWPEVNALSHLSRALCDSGADFWQ